MIFKLLNKSSGGGWANGINRGLGSGLCREEQVLTELQGSSAGVSMQPGSQESPGCPHSAGHGSAKAELLGWRSTGAGVGLRWQCPQGILRVGRVS